MRYLVGGAAVTIGWATYVAYLRDVIAGRTRPHVFSWFMWAFATLTACAVQVSGGAGLGAIGTAAPAAACLAVFVLGMRQGDMDITRTDVVFLAASLASLVLWLVADQPLTAVVLLTAVDLLAFVPTARKAWNKPHEEAIACYAGGAVRISLALFLIEHYTLVTTLYPVVWLLANGGFGVFLLARRHALTPTPAVVAVAP